MLAFGLETVRKLCYFLPIFSDSCFTSVFGNDNVKQTTCCPSLSITIIITNDNVLVNLSQKLQSCYKVGDTPRMFSFCVPGAWVHFQSLLLNYSDTLLCFSWIKLWWSPALRLWRFITCHQRSHLSENEKTLTLFPSLGIHLSSTLDGYYHVLPTVDGIYCFFILPQWVSEEINLKKCKAKQNETPKF